MDWKTATEGEEVTCWGRLFQTRAAATGKAQSPAVDSRVRLTINGEDEVELSRWQALTSATWQFVNEVWRCRPVETFIHKDCTLQTQSVPDPSASGADEGAEW